MIRLKRIPHDPIYTHGKKCKLAHETTEIITCYNTNPLAYNTGTLKLSIDSAYSHDNIKVKLKRIQKNKCAFCEENLHGQHGEVEHFRPKKFFKQNPSDKENYPGYFWLSYNWSNLLLACITCNQKWKKNLFPIKNPEKRAINHHYDVSKEKPYFINPYIEDPQNFIQFRGPLVIGIDKCNRGRVTIKYFNLNRTGETGINSIFEERKSLYDKLDAIKDSLSQISKSSPLYQKLIDNINNAKKANERFSAMVRDNF